MWAANGHDARVVLRIDSGADHPGSVSRRLADELLGRIARPGDVLIRRAATEGLPVVTGAWVAASFADGDRSALAMSDELVDELLSADELVLVAPVYNFGIPAAMKAWIDQVVRAGRTFRFTEQGPVGLLKDDEHGSSPHRPAPPWAANWISTRPTCGRSSASSVCRRCR